MMRTSLVVAILSSIALGAAEITPVERAHLVAHMEMTRDWLIDEVSSLSQAQLDFRPAPGSWTIMEVVEHLVVVGPIYWNDLQKAVQGKPIERRFADGDANILWYGIDRTYRETAVPSERPPGKLRDLREGLKTYRVQHLRLLEYVKTTKDDLRARLVPRQGSDAYQWALLISTHEQRHILQIREIKAHPGFPKK